MDKLLFVLGQDRSKWLTRDVTLDRAKKLALGWKTEGVEEIVIFALPPYSEREAYTPEDAINTALKTEPLASVKPTYNCEIEPEPKQERHGFGRGGFEGRY